MKKDYRIKLVFRTSGNAMRFLGVYEKIESDKFLFERLETCKCNWDSENQVVHSRCELIFKELDETGYRDLWNLLGKSVTSHSCIAESNLHLTLF